MREELLWLRELKARDGAGDYVLLNLDEVGIGGRHSKDRVEMRIVLKEDSDSRPIVLVHADSKTFFHRGLAGDHDFLLAERPEIIESASQVTIRRVYIARKEFSIGCRPISKYVVWSDVPRAVIAPGSTERAPSTNCHVGGLYI